jgi:hypothetical protein
MDGFEQGADPRHYPYEYAKHNELSACLMVVTQDKVIWRYDHLPNPIVMENREYSIGSGREFAYGAMSCGADAVDACEIACLHSTECGVAIDVIEWRDLSGRQRGKGKDVKAAAKTGRTRKATAPAKRAARQSGSRSKKTVDTTKR